MDIRRLSSRRKRKFAAYRWGIFSVMIWFVFIFMTTGSYIKPNLLIPLALCISMNEDELISAVVGFICGFLSNLAMGILTGSGTLLLIIGCVGTSLLFSKLLRHNLLNFTVLTAVYSALIFFLEYFFTYMIWEYDSELILLTKYILPEYLLTVVSIAAVYPAVGAVRKHLTLRKRYEPEENQALIKE